MTDNTTLPGTGDIVASNDIGGIKYQLVKVVWGAAGTANQTTTTTGKPLPVQLRGSDGTDNSNALPVTGSFFQITQPVSIAATVAVTDVSQCEWETVAASATTQVLGATGALADYLGRLIIMPATTSPGAVTLFDGSNSPDISMILFAGGASSVADLRPFVVEMNMKSVTGSWRLSTGSNISVIAVGNFT